MNPHRAPEDVTLEFKTYQDLPCGCHVIGDGTIQHPLTVKKCPHHQVSRADAMIDRMLRDRDQAATKAIDSLARYKFAMFGYWAGVWVHLNRIIGDKAANPFRDLVQAARGLGGGRGEESGELAITVRFLATRRNVDGTITLTPAEIETLAGLIGQPIA